MANGLPPGRGDLGPWNHCHSGIAVESRSTLANHSPRSSTLPRAGSKQDPGALDFLPLLVVPSPVIGIFEAAGVEFIDENGGGRGRAIKEAA